MPNAHEPRSRAASCFKGVGRGAHALTEHFRSVCYRTHKRRPAARDRVAVHEGRRFNRSATYSIGCALRTARRRSYNLARDRQPLSLAHETLYLTRYGFDAFTPPVVVPQGLRRVFRVASPPAHRDSWGRPPAESQVTVAHASFAAACGPRLG